MEKANTQRYSATDASRMPPKSTGTDHAAEEAQRGLERHRRAEASRIGHLGDARLVDRGIRRCRPSEDDARGDDQTPGPMSYPGQADRAQGRQSQDERGRRSPSEPVGDHSAHDGAEGAEREGEAAHLRGRDDGFPFGDASGDQDGREEDRQPYPEGV